ncbi:mucin-7-like [Monomorium pharaonis]|uniref:mucin-7-like n=1 Tax=Monomorium pharaonis TaxID=307658 RepID=UPI0017460A8F|nr:mucin-7-like [Monomorium pharaonis]
MAQNNNKDVEDNLDMKLDMSDFDSVHLFSPLQTIASPMAVLPPATVATLPPATVATLPPATVATLPPTTVATLPPATVATLPPASATAPSQPAKTIASPSASTTGPPPPTETIVPPSASTTAPPLPSANTAAPRIDTSASSQMRFLRPGTTTAPRASSHTNQSWRPRGTRAGMRRKAQKFFNFLFNMSDLYGRYYYQRRGGRN